MKISLNAADDGTLLAVDTSTSSMSVALMRGGELLGELNSTAERNHSIHLLPHIRQVLAEARLHSSELDAFAVGVGPGSYTGVRIGVTVAKTFAWTHGLALLGVSSLEGLALGAGETFIHSDQAAVDRADQVSSAITKLTRQHETMWIVPMIEARRGQAFTGLYQASHQGWTCKVPDGIRLMSVWADEILEQALKLPKDKQPDRILFAGETALHGEVLERFFGAWPGQSGVVAQEMRGRHIADLARRQWQAGHVENAHRLVPNYTQLTEAEAKLLSQKQS
ncbi:tRNA (adenosine(37)-N6)-threonylcarbamoyltransferase complex dimerization subunit type 1 TsaB [Paenibacillus xerothermodurans]|uniref:tRNA (Adenosine(37)-N6)-threonylcarbamoyltransferase complex dimerization subunit type 1 TsaB n=1 Tax=Paenibacillus xerothermodurans TaxID=1977292 RepID=A0A2W1NV97_PAEXE|nr:tRNA (adenosine(37)-N6)-threonylcarbamoyltransferase complex dimerization subunit type 1 TsaB [Paenibacillus xerothermodurans]PZE19612.1 tRNA (adenosine(37)-N6)-threonylcarbamoyltransferase complex dimerization subunit type 1 TsaB [Paenibacillus xerothermodurans]